MIVRGVATLLLLLAAGLTAATPSRSRSAALRDSQPGIAPFAFRAIALYPDDGIAELQFRTRSSAGAWSEWRTAVREQEGSGAFMFLEGEQTAIEVDRPARVLFIDPGQGSATAAVPATSADTPGAPAYVTRADWGCSPERCYFRGGSPAYSPVTHLIVHHTAGSNSDADFAAVMRAIWEFHVNGNGWSDIGYNWLIAPNGVLYEGRQGGDGVIGAHFSGVNTNTMGVSLMGTFSQIAPPAAMMDTLRALLAFHAAKWKLDPSGESLHASSGLRLNVISGHRDAALSPRASGSTECPGNGVYVLLPRVRQAVAKELAASLPPLRIPASVCVAADGGALDLGVTGAAVNDSWMQVSGDTVAVSANASTSRREGVVQAGWRQVRVVQAAAGQSSIPCIASRGVLTAGSATPEPVVPGSFISVYGSGFPPSPAVVVNGNRPATVLYAGTNQVNALLPSNIPIGSARLTVGGSPEVLFWVTESSPVVFAAVPVADGRALEVYFTGAGTATNVPWSASVGGRTAGKLYFGLAPGFSGLYQANITVPADLAAGQYPLQLTIAGATSTSVPVTVR